MAGSCCWGWVESTSTTPARVHSSAHGEGTCDSCREIAIALVIGSTSRSLVGCRQSGGRKLQPAMRLGVREPGLVCDVGRVGHIVQAVTPRRLDVFSGIQSGC